MSAARPRRRRRSRSRGVAVPWRRLAAAALVCFLQGGPGALPCAVAARLRAADATSQRALLAGRHSGAGRGLGHAAQSGTRQQGEQGHLGESGIVFGFKKKKKAPVDPRAERRDKIRALRRSTRVGFSCASMTTDYVTRARDVIEMMCPSYRLVWKALAMRTCQTIQGLQCLPAYYEEFCGRDPECTSLCMVLVEKNCGANVAIQQAILAPAGDMGAEDADTAAGGDPAGGGEGVSPAGPNDADAGLPTAQDGDQPSHQQLTDTGPEALLSPSDQTAIAQAQARRHSVETGSTNPATHGSVLVHRPVSPSLEAFDSVANFQAGT